MSAEANKALIRRFYAEVWNGWELGLADELLTPDVAFRGSLGVAERGPEGFKRYARLVRGAFPDLRHTVEDLVAEADRVAARVRCEGTHRDKLFGVEATGRLVAYSSVAWFRVTGGRVADGWVLGDALSLLQQLGVPLELSAAGR